MVTEVGHFPNRVYIGQDGNLYLNGAKVYNSDGNDISPQLDVLDTTVAAELAFIDGAVAGTSVANKALVLDANSELNDLGVVKTTDTLITPAQVKALNATPITVVAAPGAGIYTEFLGAYVFLDYASAAYAADAGEDLVFAYTDGTGAEVSIRADGSLFTGTADALVWVPPLGAVGAVGAIQMVENAVIVVKNLVGEWITGDSPLKIRVYHRDVRKASLEAIA